jgi:hypothetical protein
MQRTGFWRRLAPVAGIDPRALAAPRIGLGAVLLIDLWMRTGRFKALYTDAGVFPRLYLEPWMRHTLVPLHLLSGSVAWEAFLFAVAAVFAVALLLGYHARIAAVVSRQGSRTERDPDCLQLRRGRGALARGCGPARRAAQSAAPGRGSAVALADRSLVHRRPVEIKIRAERAPESASDIRVVEHSHVDGITTAVR